MSQPERQDDSHVDEKSFFGSFADFMLAKGNSPSMYLSCGAYLSAGNLLSSERFVARHSKAIFVTTRMNQSSGRDSLNGKGCVVYQYYRLLDHRVDCNGNIKFLIEWKPTWVASDELIDLVDLHVSRSAVLYELVRMKLK